MAKHALKDVGRSPTIDLSGQRLHLTDRLELSPTGKESEDRLVVREDRLGVLVVDGATDLSGKLYSGHTGGWWAAEWAAKVFEELDPDEPDPLGSFLREVRYELRNLRDREDIIGEACVAMVWLPTRTIYWVGDCRVLAFQPNMQPEIYTSVIPGDALCEALRAEAIRQAREGGETHLGRLSAIGRAAIAQQLQENRGFANMEDSDNRCYGVLSATPTPGRFVKKAVIPVDTEELIVHSDGVPVSCMAMTAEATLKNIAALAAQDPLLVGDNPRGFASTKGFVTPDGEVGQVFDDTTWARFDLK